MSARWKRHLKKFWHFLWEEDSLTSWLVNIVLAFILIKFFIYPGLGFLFGTTHPVVAVVSGSMEHKITSNNGVLNLCGKTFQQKKRIDFDAYWGQCGGWYLKNTNITKTMFMDFPFKHGFNTGDIMVLFGNSLEKVNVGDVIVFYAYKPEPIIHRVVRKWQKDGNYFFQTKGDHNGDSWAFERAIPGDRIIGKAFIRIPYLGYIKIGFVNLLSLLGLSKIAKLF